MEANVVCGEIVAGPLPPRALRSRSIEKARAARVVVVEVWWHRGEKKSGGLSKKNSKLSKKIKCQVFEKGSEDQKSSPCAAPSLSPTIFARLALVERGASDRKK